MGDLETFLRLRPRLLALAYRMLGATGEAEEVVQEAWLRWQSPTATAVDRPEAWLATVVARLSIDRLRQTRAARRAYIGPWLPEPWVGDVPAPPEATAPDRRLDRAADLSTAFLLLLQRLSPTERAAFLLRDAMGMDYAAIAATLRRSETATRQIVHRARARLAQPGTPRPASPEVQQRLLIAFLRASRDGDATALQRLLAEGATWTADGGGRVRTALKVIQGRDRIIRLALGLRSRRPPGLMEVPASWNGQPGILGLLADVPWYAMQVATDDDRIQAVHVLRNPDKLRHFTSVLSQPAIALRHGG